MTQHILKWRRSTQIEGYESTDGRFQIERSEGLTTCENPHPMGRSGYCEGGQEHEYTYWVLWDGEEKVNAHATFREMKSTAQSIVDQEN